MASLPKYVTPEEYLAIDRNSEYKHEYYEGEIIAMSGASRAHNLITINIGTELNTQLKNHPCEVYPSDMRVRVPKTNRYFYPDVSVVCGEPRFEGDRQDILLNPILIVEVLSDSTESYDRGRKFNSYRKIDSLAYYLLVAQNERRVHLYARQADNRWLFSEASRLKDTVLLDKLSCKLAIADIHSKVRFENVQS